MAETYTLLRFSALPVESVESELVDYPYYGVFLCSGDHPDALQFLDDILARKSLRRNQTGEFQLIPKTQSLGGNEDLRVEAEEQGYGLSLVKMHFPKR